MKFNRVTPVTIAVLLGGIAACSSSSDTGPDGGNGPNACTLTLTGAESGSPTCDAALAAWTSEDNKSVFGITSLESAPFVEVALDMNGQLNTGTYHNTDSGLVTAIVVSDSSRGWDAEGGDPDEPTVGSFTLNITSVNTTYSDTNGKVYTVHGTLTATLQADPQTDATGTITLTAKF